MSSPISARLSLLRKESGISQKQCAMELNISQALLSHYERGIRECGIDFLIKVCDYYNVSADYLLCRSDERIPSSNKRSQKLRKEVVQKLAKTLESNAKITEEINEIISILK